MSRLRGVQSDDHVRTDLRECPRILQLLEVGVAERRDIDDVGTVGYRCAEGPDDVAAKAGLENNRIRPIVSSQGIVAAAALEQIGSFTAYAGVASGPTQYR